MPEEPNITSNHPGQGDEERDHWGDYFDGMVAPDAPISEAGTASDERLWALSQIAAWIAEQTLESAQALRQKYLPEGVLSPARLYDWVGKNNVGSPSMILTDVTLELLALQPDGSYILPAHQVREIKENTYRDLTSQDPFSPAALSGEIELPRLTNKYLYIMEPRSGPRTEEHKIRGIPVRLGGVLDKVREFSLRFLSAPAVWDYNPELSPDKRRSWVLARAATFLLTGHTPLVSEHLFPSPAGRGSRLQTTKHLQLAVFTVQHPHESLRHRMEIWNQRYPKWAYTQTTNFGWDGAQAVRRLMTFPHTPPPAPASDASRPDLTEWVALVLDRVEEHQPSRTTVQIKHWDDEPNTGVVYPLG